MVLPTHIAAGYLISQIYIFNFSLEVIDSDLITAIVIAGSFAPDIDALFGRKLKDHRKSPLHAPLIWLLLFLTVILIGFIKNKKTIIVYSTAFIIGVLFHLFLDWFSARVTGIWIFYPFSRKQYSLFSRDPKKAAFSLFPNRNNIGKYKEFAKFYFKNKFLVAIEAIIITIAILVLIKS